MSAWLRSINRLNALTRLRSKRTDSKRIILQKQQSLESTYTTGGFSLIELREAMKSRATIEQAKGILMERHKLTAETAFNLLVKASQAQNRKLRDIASELVTSVERSNVDKNEPPS